MKKSIAFAVSKGLVLAALSQTAMAADELDYRIHWNDADGRYYVYMRPSVTPSPDRSMTAQVTIVAPHAAGAQRFEVSDVKSSVSGTTWSHDSKAYGPTENPDAAYLSFSMANPSPANAFAWQGGEEIEVFSFVNTGECLGPVALLDNNNDPFVTPVNNGGRNSMGTNPGNSFSNLGWDAGNNYGGNYGGSADCRTTAANNDPVAVNDSVSVEQGSAVNIDVLSNDSDADLDILTLTSVGRASKGTASILNGRVHYVLNAGSTGADSFTYTLSDGKGGSATATVSVTITSGQPTNASPVAAPDSVSVVAASSTDIDVLSNDRDPDSDSLTLTAVGQAPKGTVSIVNGKVRYVPDSGYTGADSFTYTVSDGKGGEATGTVTVTITLATASDNDGDGLSNDDEAALGTNPDVADSDGDGIGDLHEVGGDVSSPVDTDGDGTIDALDEDDDNDSIPTRLENYNGGLPTDDDTDRDGTPDYLDPDDDNDGIPTAQEGPAGGDQSAARDTNGDGRPDYLQRPGNFAPEEQRPIPTLTEWAQILLSMLLGLVWVASGGKTQIDNNR